MCAFLRDNNMKLLGTQTGAQRRNCRGVVGICRRLCMALLTFSIITTGPNKCTASAVMMTPPLSPSTHTHIADNVAAAKSATVDTSFLTNATTAVAAANNTTNNLSPYSTPMSTNSPPPQRISPPRVELNKCCLFGEYLDKTKTCVPGATDKWIPLIFLINRKMYYRPEGSSPKFITFQDNVFPIGQERSMDDDNKVTFEENDVSCTVDDLTLFTGSNSFIIFSNGSLFLSKRSISVPPSRYCVDQQAALVCFPTPKHREPSLKLKKCCGPHALYDNQLKECDVDVNNQLNLSLPENITYQTIYGFPECPEGSTTYAIAGDWIESELLSDTTGHLHLPKHQKKLQSEDYCLENVRNDRNSSSGEMIKVFACLHHFGKENTQDKIQNAAINFSLVISVIFLAATLVASYLMPSIHHVLHWRCQFYYVFCLFIGEFLLAFSLLYEPLKLEFALCQIVASAMHFFFLAAFFWLNTMCFNIWWTFRDFRPSSLERNQELIRLRLYSAYAWGIPLLIAAIAACVNLVPDSSLLRPGFGEKSCWFNDDNLPIFAYFFGPVGILLSINIMLFISTTHQLTCGLWKRDDVKSTTEKTALVKVCLKLVVVMGVTWIVDVISWFVVGPDGKWFVADLVNSLQGIFIFIVVGCQPQVWAACKRFCCPRSRQEITNTTNGVQHSSSSQGLPSMAACGGEITQNTSIHNTTVNSVGGGGVGGGGGLGNHIPTTTTTTMKIPMETVC